MVTVYPTQTALSWNVSVGIEKKMTSHQSCDTAHQIAISNQRN
jgi:hypothetical protein